jgi:ribose 5-phosphate isomerase A
MRVIGIGSGSTVPYVVERIVQQGEDANRERCVRSVRATRLRYKRTHRWFVPTGFQSKELIVQVAYSLLLSSAAY